MHYRQVSAVFVQNFSNKCCSASIFAGTYINNVPLSSKNPVKTANNIHGSHEKTDSCTCVPYE